MSFIMAKRVKRQCCCFLNDKRLLSTLFSLIFEILSWTTVETKLSRVTTSEATMFIGVLSAWQFRPQQQLWETPLYDAGKVVTEAKGVPECPGLIWQCQVQAPYKETCRSWAAQWKLSNHHPVIVGNILNPLSCRDRENSPWEALASSKKPEWVLIQRLQDPYQCNKVFYSISQGADLLDNHMKLWHFCLGPSSSSGWACPVVIHWKVLVWLWD